MAFNGKIQPQQQEIESETIGFGNTNGNKKSVSFSTANGSAKSVSFSTKLTSLNTSNSTTDKSDEDDDDADDNAQNTDAKSQENLFISEKARKEYLEQQFQESVDEYTKIIRRLEKDNVLV